MHANHTAAIFNVVNVKYSDISEMRLDDWEQNDSVRIYQYF